MRKSSVPSGYALVTGGAGFIGTNLVDRLAREGTEVVILDNFSRNGVERNAQYLETLSGGLVRIVRDDCRNAKRVFELVSGASQIFHFAAQVAVTTSLVDPLLDFEVNARGVLNVLEAVRQLEQRPPLIFTSTNKVYGSLPGVRLIRSQSRYEPADTAVRNRGISETQPLDFHSPYGCSKGAADQYVLDYARSFDLPTAVFRMSCIYGPHQCGNEDQGWVAHFLMRALNGGEITIYGDGYQVRDVLYVDDLVDALLRARDSMDSLRGQAFNIGGGVENAVSLRELLAQMEELLGYEPKVSYGSVRTGDQRYYVSDISKFRRATGWAPKVHVKEGLGRLHAWLTRANAASSRERAVIGELPKAPPLRASAALVR